MLKITLRDGEKAIINGAVISGCGRATIMVENDCSILRGKDIMKPEEASTPSRRLYFATMMAYLDPANLADHQNSLLTYLEDLMGALESLEARALCTSFARKVLEGRFYQAMSDCRRLMAYEDRVIGLASQNADVVPLHASAA